MELQDQLDEAVCSGSVDQFEKLQAAGVDFSTKNLLGQTILWKVVTSRYVDAVKWLVLQGGVSPDVIDKNGNKVLDVAGRSTEIWMFLVSSGMNLNYLAGATKYTPLRRLVEYEGECDEYRCRRFKALVKNGCNPFLCCGDGHTVLDRLGDNDEYMRRDIEKYFLKYQACSIAPNQGFGVPTFFQLLSQDILRDTIKKYLFPRRRTMPKTDAQETRFLSWLIKPTSHF
jgi:hypothetical protein